MITLSFLSLTSCMISLVRTLTSTASNSSFPRTLMQTTNTTSRLAHLRKLFASVKTVDSSETATLSAFLVPGVDSHQVFHGLARDIY